MTKALAEGKTQEAIDTAHCYPPIPRAVTTVSAREDRWRCVSFCSVLLTWELGVLLGGVTGLKKENRALLYETDFY